MVSVLSCLLPARHRPDNEKRSNNPTGRTQPGDSDLGATPRTERARPGTALSDSLPAPGGIGESPNPAHFVRQKRSSFTTFFAFSSKRKSAHGPPILRLQQDLLSPRPIPGRWVSDRGRTQVHVINPASIPSPLQGGDDEEYYYAYYTALTPTFPSASPHQDLAQISPSKLPSSRPQDLSTNRDLDSQLSSPVDSHPSHTQIHPYSYSTPLDSNMYAKSTEPTPPLRHTSSQPFQHHLQGSRSEVNAKPARDGIPPSQVEASKNWSHMLHPQSVSTPNLASGATPVRLRSLLRKKPPPRPKGQERWLSAETWWDALLSPSPRFKVKQAPRRPHTAAGRINHTPMNNPVQGEPNREIEASLSATRPRAVSATSNVRPTLRVITRSRSADLLRRPSTSGTSRTGFEPALETLADDPTSTPDQIPNNDAEDPLPDPSLSLEQVIDEREAFELQRAKWKQQASKSLGNKHTRSISRARSKSFNERHVHVHYSSEGSKSHSNFEFLAARTLLGSQSTMPVVHITKPSLSSSHSKAYSHSHSHSAHSYTQTSHSHAYSHSHSQSLTTSSSSKSSRNPPRGHSRNGSWSRAALLKAGALCGINHDESYDGSADEKLPSSSRGNVKGTIPPTGATTAGAPEAANVSPTPSVPSGEVGIAVTSSPCSGSFDPNAQCRSYASGSQHQEGDQESRWSSNYTHKSSDYAGPHPSVVDSKLPQLGASSNISLRHRLPPRAAIHPPLAPVAHPYRSISAQPDRVVNKGGEGAALQVTETQGAAERSPDQPYPHVSLSNADFESYGVGEALVYASALRPEKIPEAGPASEESRPSSRATEPPPPKSGSHSSETVILRLEDPDTSSSATNGPPSLTNSSFQMFMPAFNSPDDFDEFQDLFYKPLPVGRDRHQAPSLNANQVPTDIRGSASSSPLTHLVRKLSEEVQSQRGASRTPSDRTRRQRLDSEDHRSTHSGTKFVFMDVAQSASSPPIETASQTHLPIQKDNEPPTQPVMVIPEDVNSFYTASVLESPSEEQENDTFGIPIKRGELEAVTAPALIEPPARSSTHISIEQGGNGESDNNALSPLTARSWLSSADAARSSYLTTSDLSHMSRLSDFPLPPDMHPSGQHGQTSILRAYREAMPPTPEAYDHQSEDETETDEEDGTDEEEEEEEDHGTSGDVEETLRALRMPPRVTSYESRRTTFGGTDDMDIIVRLHQPSP